MEVMDLAAKHAVTELNLDPDLAITLYLQMVDHLAPARHQIQRVVTSVRIIICYSSTKLKGNIFRYVYVDLKR